VGRPEQKLEERRSFQAFYDMCPGFAGEEIREWYSAKHDPPDVICVTASGRRVGVELCQWAHSGEMNAGKLREAIERKIRDAIGTPQPHSRSKNFRWLVFFPKSKVYIKTHEYSAFRESLVRLIEHADRTLTKKQGGQALGFGELYRFPPIDKCFESVRFVLGEALTSGVDWIVPAGRFDTFDERPMTDPLLQQLRKKAMLCGTLRTPCDEACLVVTYDEALPYCSPLGTRRRSVQDIAREAAEPLVADRSPFTHVFLFVAVEPGQKVYQLLRQRPAGHKNANDTSPPSTPFSVRELHA